ncbi:MAG TPA: HAMP domain-containing sensor histidine kinase [Actinomycetota bacterium]
MDQTLANERRLEAQLVTLRWLVAAFASVQVGFALRDRGLGPTYVLPLGVALVLAIAVGNTLIGRALEGELTGQRLRWLGAAAFLLDTVVLLGVVWLAEDGPADPVWVIGYLIPLEGAARWGVPGALLGVALFAGGEVVRGVTLASVSPSLRTAAPILGFRIGMAAVVGVVAGVFASSLRRQAALSEARAGEAEAAVAREEAAARRERQARGEVAALHAALLSTPTDEEFGRSLPLAAEAIARELECAALGLLLREPGIVGEVAFAALGVTGDPGYLAGERIYPAMSPIANAAETGEPVVDGRDAVAPMRVRGEVVGAIHERAAEEGVLDEERLLLLSRLADQLGLVLETARLRADQEETVERLRELDAMKRDFVAVTSHELRTPLAGIRGFVDMLRRRGDDVPASEREEYLDIVMTQTDRLIRLVDDLLVVSRVEAGKLSLEPEETDLASFCDRLVRSFGELAARVEVAPADDAPARMLVDARRLAQIITNLVHNALKFAPDDTIVTLSYDAPSEGIVTFRVHDRGPGIAPEELERIFERFHQTEQSISHTEGFGLGLYITKQLVEAMGGWVDVSSTLGEGTTFAVTLPEDRSLPTPSRPSAPARSGRTAS